MICYIAHVYVCDGRNNVLESTAFALMFTSLLLSTIGATVSCNVQRLIDDLAVIFALPPSGFNSRLMQLKRLRLHVLENRRGSMFPRVV